MGNVIQEVVSKRWEYIPRSVAACQWLTMIDFCIYDVGVSEQFATVFFPVVPETTVVVRASAWHVSTQFREKPEGLRHCMAKLSELHG